jgi:hypothetical protein
MVYMPCVATLLPSSPNDTFELHETASLSQHPENILLFLPSSLPPTLHPELRSTGVSPGLLEKEIKLRIGQADDALAELRRQRRVITGLVLFKKLNVSGTGQKKNTRIRTLFKRFSNKTERIAERYRHAYQALVAVDAEGDWSSRLRVLLPEDIRGPGREDYDKINNRPEVSERRREQSWIWLVPRVETAPDIGVMEEHLDANLRVEWAKSRARAARWTEDVDLLLEEMRRTLTFFERKAAWWRGRKHLRVDEPEDIRHGIEAYAEKQAVLLERRAVSYAKYWLPLLKSKGVIPCWSDKYGGGGEGEPDVAKLAGDDGDEEQHSESEGEDIDITEDQVHDDFEIEP